MSKQSRDFQLPLLEEHHFHSSAPVLGPLIAWIRNKVYNVAARWGVQTVITRQNQINALLVVQLQDMMRYLGELETRLQEYEERLINQDRDLTLLARTLAEVDIRQRHLAKSLTRQERVEGD
jgi:hypothetical protein